MIRVFLAALCVVVCTAAAPAASLDDLKAANAAAEHANGDEAIRLYSQALAAGDLSPADQLAARKGRGDAYVGRSLVADAFERLDQARDLRQKAIADFTAALAIKNDEADLYLSRARVYHLDGQFDAAIADFDAALKLDKSQDTLLQRAGSETAKGDYDRAVADYSAALGMTGKDGKGPEPTDIYSLRGFTQFIGGRYAAAATDLAQAISLGAAGRTGDVLWLPYQAAWLHIARARGGENDAEELARNAAKIDVKQWPGTLIAYFLGKAKLDELTANATHGGGMGHARECNVAFFAGEQALSFKDATSAATLLTRARATCNIHTVHYLAAGVELKRLGK